MTQSDIEYFASPALSKSRIDLLLECPARYKADIDGDVEEKDSAALSFGTLTHLLTLQPEAFDSEYAVTDLSLATKEGKAFKKDAEERGLEIIKSKDLEKAMFMADAVRSHWQCSVLFDNPHVSEEAVYWTYNGVDCKAKPDIVTTLPDGRRILGDLKTTDSANPDHCRKSIMKYGYYRQAAWYLSGMAAIGKPCDAFVFMFVEKSRPHLVTCFDVSEAALVKGMQECNEAVERLKECRNTGVWPCYTKDILTFELPEWAK